MVYQNPVDGILHEVLLRVGFRQQDGNSGYLRYLDVRKTDGQTPREVRVIPGQTPYAMKHIVLSGPILELEAGLKDRRLNVVEGVYFPVNDGKAEWPSRLIW